MTPLAPLDSSTVESAMAKEQLGTKNDPIVIDSPPASNTLLRSPVKILDGDQYRYVHVSDHVPVLLRTCVLPLHFC